MRFLLCPLVAAALWVGVPGIPARAADAQLTVGAGIFELVSDRQHVAEADLVYRFGAGWRDGGDGAFRGVHPIVGVMGNSRSGAMGWAGLAAPFVWNRWEVEPAVGAGAYHQGNSKYLGGAFQFHLALRVSYAVTDSGSLGLGFMHISNGGLHDKNPGANSVLVVWTWRLGH
jgi:hypothetical protein